MPVLLALLADPDPKVPRFAAYGLHRVLLNGGQVDPRIPAALRVVAGDDDPGVREAAREALKDLGGQERQR